MTGEQKILDGIRNNPKELKDMYDKMFQLYETEFPKGWLLKELDEAKSTLTMIGGVARSLERTFTFLDKEFVNAFGYWVGTMEVTKPNFVLYSKGLYFMAAYKLTLK